MKLPPITRIIVEDFPSSVQEWISKLIDPLNNFMRVVKTGVDKGITVNDNLSGAIKTITITPTSGGLFEAQFVYTSKKPPKVVLIGGWVDKTGTTTLSSGVTPVWSWNGKDLITITDITGLNDAHKYDITFLILDD